MKKEEYVMSQAQAKIIHALGTAFEHPWAKRWSAEQAAKIQLLTLIEEGSRELTLTRKEGSIHQFLGSTVIASHGQLASWAVDPVGFVDGSVKKGAQNVLSFQIMKISGIVTGPHSHIGISKIAKEHWFLLTKIVNSLGINQAKIKIMFEGTEKETLKKVLESFS